MILVAVEEPRLYQLLFMAGDGQAHSFEEAFDTLGNPAVICIDILKKDYGLNEVEVRTLFQHVWVYTFGIGAVRHQGMPFFQEEIIDLLGQDFQFMLMRIKTGA